MAPLKLLFVAPGEQTPHVLALFLAETLASAVHCAELFARVHHCRLRALAQDTLLSHTRTATLIVDICHTIL